MSRDADMNMGASQQDEGSDIARAAFARARTYARGQARSQWRSHGRVPLRRRWQVSTDEVLMSGPGPDARDPMRLGVAVDQIVASRGWTDAMAMGALVGQWEQIAGPDVAAHVQIESMDPSEGVLVLRTTSTAWATQIRLLLPALRGRIEDQVGPDLVRSVRVLGPTAPSWRSGPRHVPGRGPRDTYG